MPGFCCPFGLFHRFGGVLRCFSQLAIDEVKALQSCFETDLNREAVFSPKFGSTARFSPPTQRRIVHLPPFPVGLENNSSFPLFSSSSFPPFRTIFASLLNYSGAFHFPSHPVTVLSSMACRHSLTTATCYMGGVVGRG